MKTVAPENVRPLIMRAMRPALRAYHRAKRVGTPEAWETFTTVHDSCVEAIASLIPTEDE